MKQSESSPGMVVRFLVWSGGESSQPVYARIESVGRQRATVTTEYGKRIQKRLTELSAVRDEEESVFFQKRLAQHLDKDFNVPIGALNKRSLLPNADVDPTTLVLDQRYAERVALDIASFDVLLNLKTALDVASCNYTSDPCHMNIAEMIYRFYDAGWRLHRAGDARDLYFISPSGKPTCKSRHRVWADAFLAVQAAKRVRAAKSTT